MADTNTGLTRSFRFGGKLIIGGDTVLNIPEGGGGFSCKFGVKKRMYDAAMDQGRIGIVREGDDTFGTWNISIRYTGDAGVTDSFVDRFTKDSTDGSVVTEDAVIEVYSKSGGAAGESFTFSSSHVDDNGIDYNVGGGTEMDVLKGSFVHDARKPAIAILGP